MIFYYFLCALGSFDAQNLNMCAQGCNTMNMSRSNSQVKMSIRMRAYTSEWHTYHGSILKNHQNKNPYICSEHTKALWVTYHPFYKTFSGLPLPKFYGHTIRFLHSHTRWTSSVSNFFYDVWPVEIKFASKVTCSYAVCTTLNKLIKTSQLPYLYIHC